MLRIVLALVLAALVQSPEHERAGLQSRFVSPDVVATWSVGGGSAGHDTLRLLVLWRGTGGWARRAGSLETHGLSVGNFEYAQQIVLGPYVFTVAGDLRSPHAQIDGHEVDLRSSNVFLVDSVDTPSAPRALDAMWVEPDLPADAGFETIVRRERVLRAFLRCDRVARTDVVGGTLCDGTLGP
jgi:hypothetical protein